ncbi:MAG: Fic family protein [bacterium]
MSYDSLRKLYYKNKSEYKKIYEQRFDSENTIKFNFKINQNTAFYFNHFSIHSKCLNISTLDKEVSSLLSKLPPIEKDAYEKKCIVDEILFTNEIEGVISTRKDIISILDQVDDVTQKPSKISSLINKYKSLVLDEFIEIKNSNDIREIYNSMLLDEVEKYDEEDIPDGMIFRKNEVYLKNQSGNIIHTGVMPESNIILLMEHSISILNDKKIDLPIRVSIFHYLFAYIHPFYDGNGRMDRYITSIYLKEYYNPIIAFRISQTINENKSQYYEAFKHTNENNNLGDISTFVYNFIDIIEKAFINTKEYLIEKIISIENGNNFIFNLKLDDYSYKLLFLLFQIKLFKDEDKSINELCNILSLGETKCRESIKKLLNDNFISFNKRSSKKVYCFNEELFNKIINLQ